jgi:hypothetical protein
MQKQAMDLFVFSFICFIGVFVFGSILGPLQKIYSDPQVVRNFNLFHNHFDQLCWLGAAAIGAFFYAAHNRYNGSERILRTFTITYMLGTTLFSFAFLVRGVGLIVMSKMLEEEAYIGLVSLGGLFNVITLIAGIYVIIGIISASSDGIKRISSSAFGNSGRID